MDEEQQKERSIGRIEAIVSSRLGNFQVYETVDAEEVHGEFWACNVLKVLWKQPSIFSVSK